MQLPAGGANTAEDEQGQQAAMWLQSLELHHLVTPLQQNSLLTLRALRASDVSLLIQAGCNADEAKVSICAVEFSGAL